MPNDNNAKYQYTGVMGPIYLALELKPAGSFLLLCYQPADLRASITHCSPLFWAGSLYPSTVHAPAKFPPRGTPVISHLFFNTYQPRWHVEIRTVINFLCSIPCCHSGDGAEEGLFYPMKLGCTLLIGFLINVSMVRAAIYICKAVLLTTWCIWLTSSCFWLAYYYNIDDDNT